MRGLDEGDRPGKVSQLFEVPDRDGPLRYGGYGALPGVFEPPRTS